MDASAVVIPPYVAGPLRLAPFRALRLRPSKVGDPASARLYARPYAGVAARLTSWRERGDLAEDPSTAVYVHEYSHSGLTVAGVVGALDVSRRTAAPGCAAVLPHEGVHPEQVHELARRMREMAVNPAPILLVQDYPEAARKLVRAVRSSPPDDEFIDRGTQHHRLWRVTDPAVLDALNAAWQQARTLIADGHHRYAAYLQIQSSSPGGPTDHGLAMVVDQPATPLHIGAIHRTVARTHLGDLRAAAERLGLRWQCAPHGEAVAALAPDTMVVTDGAAWASMRADLDEDGTAVELLHSRLLPALDGAPRRIHHHHTVDDALRHIRRSRDLAILMPAPTLAHIWATVLEGRVLPEKATSFQPKPHPGVLIRPLSA